MRWGWRPAYAAIGRELQAIDGKQYPRHQVKKLLSDLRDEHLGLDGIFDYLENLERPEDYAFEAWLLWATWRHHRVWAAIGAEVGMTAEAVRKRVWRITKSGRYHDLPALMKIAEAQQRNDPRLHLHLDWIAKKRAEKE